MKIVNQKYIIHMQEKQILKGMFPTRKEKNERNRE